MSEVVNKETVPSNELVGELESATQKLRDKARSDLGITGGEVTESLRTVIREEGASYYPLIALSALGLANYLEGYAFIALSPDIARSLGIGIAAIAGITSLERLAISISPFPMAWLTQHKARRAMLCILTGIAWGVMTLYTGFITATAGLIAIHVLDGLTSGSVLALHFPLLLDSYPPRARVRAASFYSAIGYVGVPFLASALLVAALTGPFNLTWRGVFVVLGILTLILASISLRLRDPGFGGFDTQRIRATVHESHGDSSAQISRKDVQLGFFEVMRRLMLIPSIRRLSFGELALGIFTVPLNAFVAFFLDERFGLGPTGRSLFFGATSVASVITIVLFAKRMEALFRKDPARVPVIGGYLIAGVVIAYAVAVAAPAFAVVITLFCIGFGLQALLVPIFNVSFLALVESPWRPHLSALAGIFISLGGFLGALFLSGIESRFGLGGSIISLAIPGLVAAGIVASARHTMNTDLDRMITQVVEDEEIERIRSSGAHLPMLACRKIDFSYGKLQVLFDVDFTVDDGEMVALLGVNGAGKSTLLKVVSGIGLPSKGSVRFQGQDVTYLDAERRLRLGITQVPGGRAVFPPLTVIDNLRVYGHALSRKGRELDDAIERSFEAFPRLHERRNQAASTLSGGEQQMLGLCKALILRPRLLLIDELSLGLAPVIVGQLLEMVREINASGTAVVLVEQSVNIALSVARHAYFMERGQVQFDGPSQELLDREDLLRAVFLEGAGRRDAT